MLHGELKPLATTLQTLMESRYVKVASRFFLVDNAGAGLGHRHFLDACFLCKRDITSNRHVFMYKGDAAFCSDGCRQEQMNMDAALAAVARRHLTLHGPSTSPAAASERGVDKPAVADLTTHAPVVSG